MRRRNKKGTTADALCEHCEQVLRPGQENIKEKVFVSSSLSLGVNSLEPNEKRRGIK